MSEPHDIEDMRRELIEARRKLDMQGSPDEFDILEAKLARTKDLLASTEMFCEALRIRAERAEAELQKMRDEAIEKRPYRVPAVRSVPVAK